jgi:hypothetical protein
LKIITGVWKTSLADSKPDAHRGSCEIRIKRHGKGPPPLFIQMQKKIKKSLNSSLKIFYNTLDSLPRILEILEILHTHLFPDNIYCDSEHNCSNACTKS